MDSLDREILKALQNNCRRSTEELGNLIGLSATACQRRIRKLKASGKIKQEVAILDGARVGQYITVIINVALKQGSAENVDKLKQQMLNHPKVQQCYYVTGENDFVLIAIAEDMVEYEKLTRELFFVNPAIKHFNSTVVMENVKVGMAIPL